MLSEAKLSRRVVYQVSTADNVCHALESVIDDNGELIGPESVGSPNNKIADFSQNVLFKRTLPSVIERDETVVYKKAPRTNRCTACSMATSSGIAPCGKPAAKQAASILLRVQAHP